MSRISIDPVPGTRCHAGEGSKGADASGKAGRAQGEVCSTSGAIATGEPETEHCGIFRKGALP